MKNTVYFQPQQLYLGSAEKLNKKNDWFYIPVLCTLKYYSFFQGYRYFATLWLHITP